MSIEGTLGYKTFDTHAALERPFADMFSNVNLLVVFSRISPVADGAGKRVDGTVNGLVLLAVTL